MTKTAVIYARYSTERQDAVTIDAQIRSCEAYAVSNGYIVAGRFSDNETSGSRYKSREGIQKLLKFAGQGGVDIVICTQSDRLSRDVEHAANIWKKLKHLKIKLHAVHSGGEVSKLEHGIRSVLSDELLDDLRTKTREGQREHFLRGKAVAGISYGYKVKPIYDEKGDRIPGHRLIDEDQARIVLRIFKEYADGASPQKIATGLNDESIPGPRGLQWRDTAIRGHKARATGILNNEMYLGRMLWNRQNFSRDPDTEKRQARINDQIEWERVEVPNLQIVDVALWNAVKAQQLRVADLFDYTATNNLNRTHRPRYMLSGLVECAYCGGPYAVMAKDRYGCTNRKKKLGCSNSRTIMRSELETRVAYAFPDTIYESASVERIQRSVAQKANESLDQYGDHKNALVRKLSKNQTEINNIVQVVASGASSSALLEALTKLEKTKVELLAEIDGRSQADRPEIPPSIVSPSMLRASILALCKLSLTNQQSATGQAWVNLVRNLVQRVVVTPDEPKGVTLQVHGRLATILASIDAWNHEEKRLRATGAIEFRKLKAAGALRTTEDRLRFMENINATLKSKKRSFERFQLSVVAGTGFEPVTFRL